VQVSHPVQTALPLLPADFLLATSVASRVQGESSVPHHSVTAPSPHDKLHTRVLSSDGKDENEDGKF